MNIERAHYSPAHQITRLVGRANHSAALEGACDGYGAGYTPAPLKKSACAQ